MPVKQNSVTIPLRDLMDSEDGWGHAAGRLVHERLLDFVEQRPEAVTFRISLKGVHRTDASFPRESVVELARRFRSKIAFVLTDISDSDLLENWDAAARKREQPMLALQQDGSFQVLGPGISEGMRPLFELFAGSSGMTTAEAAAKLGQSVPNISNKMKSLWESGYVMRMETMAPSGGIEFEYFIAY